MKARLLRARFCTKGAAIRVIRVIHRIRIRRGGLWPSGRVGPILAWTFAIATVLGVAFGKGVSRLFFAGWSISMLVVFQMIYMLQFD